MKLPDLSQWDDAALAKLIPCSVLEARNLKAVCRGVGLKITRLQLVSMLYKAAEKMSAIYAPAELAPVDITCGEYASKIEREYAVMQDAQEKGDTNATDQVQ